MQLPKHTLMFMAIVSGSATLPAQAKDYYVSKTQPPVFRAPVHPYAPPVIVAARPPSTTTTVTTTTVSQPYGGQWTQQTTTYGTAQPATQCLTVVHGQQVSVPCNVTYQHPAPRPGYYGSPVVGYPQHGSHRNCKQHNHRHMQHSNHQDTYQYNDQRFYATPNVSVALPPFVFNVRL